MPSFISKLNKNKLRRLINDELGFEGGDSTNKSMAVHQDQIELEGLENFASYTDIFNNLTEYHYI